jgi:hypothetical protein
MSKVVQCVTSGRGEAAWLLLEGTCSTNGILTRWWQREHYPQHEAETEGGVGSGKRVGEVGG